MTLFAELRRRNAFRRAGLCLVGAWLLVQVASTTLAAFGVPDWILRNRGQSNLAFETFAARAATWHRGPNISNARLLWPLFSDAYPKARAAAARSHEAAAP
jgi:hypothetical protein